MQNEDATIGGSRAVLKGLSLDALEDWVEERLGERRFRGRQLFRWMYQRQADGFAEMTDISKDLRARLAEVATVHALALESVHEATDGTRKLLFRVNRTGGRVESVWIPSDDRVTLCISSQVGCALACDFCLTGRMGLHGQLTAGEIVDQVVWARRLFDSERRLSNIVFMGMGEPLHNYDAVVAASRLLIDDRALNLSRRKVTVSTVGLVPGIEKLGREPDLDINLAVSLSATTDAVRDRLMPINRKYPIARLMAALEAYPLPRRSRITISYVMLDGVNDSADDAERLARLLRGLRCKVNLIPFNPHPGAAYGRPPRSRVEQFQEIMQRRHYNCRIRETRGDDRLAACGQLGGGVDGRLPERPPRSERAGRGRAPITPTTP